MEMKEYRCDFSITSPLTAMLEVLPDQARILFLCQSLKGLTTSIVFPVRLSKDFASYDT